MFLKIPIRVTKLLLFPFVWGCALGIQFVDLGHDLSLQTPSYNLPGYFPFQFITQVANNDTGNWYAFNTFKLPEHTGTHIDAPYHFYRDGYKLHEIPLEKLFAPVVVMDIRSKVKDNALYSMTAQDVNDWVSKHGLIPNNSVVIVYTGWSSRYPDNTKYIGHPFDTSQAKYPSIDEGAIRAILDFKKSHGLQIVGFGTDTISPDLVPVTTIVHELTASQNIYLLENLNGNLAKLPSKGARLMVMPMKIKDGTGAPARVIARLPYN